MSLARRLEPWAAAIVIPVLALGTWSQFALPYPRGAPWLDGCYFTDALIVFVRCGDAVPAGMDALLTWLHYLTWGLPWLLAFVVMAPLIGIPVATLWLTTVFLAARWIWRTIRERLPRASARSAAS